MKRFVLAITLACMLSASALAGEIHSTGPESAPGDIQSPPSVAATIIVTILSLVR